MTILTDIMDTPLGEMRIGVDPNTDTLVMLDFHDRKSIDRLFQQRISVLGEAIPGNHPLIDTTKQQLTEYFDGQRMEFDLPLQFIGTDFQKKVWHELTTIPYGTTRSYGEMAVKMNKPVGSSRAIGTANGKNIIAIVVPCHRVIGADGSLVGYGGGMHRKKKLLEHETKFSNQSSLEEYF